MADDNPAARQIIQEIFLEWGLNVDLVASGPEVIGAMEIAASANKPFDVVLLDWKMPGMDGMETVQAMRSNTAIKKKPIIVMITAYGNDEFINEAEKADIAAFISKPVEPKGLFDTITNLITATTERDGASAPAAPGLPMVQPEFSGLRVLLVEDNEINREIAIELLTDAGLVVDTAENGLIACERVEAEGLRYSAVLMDVQMPEMDGLEATGVIRRTWDAEKLPIIAMTAHAYEEERQRCFAAGMNDHIAKPVDPDAMVKTLNRWLKLRQVTAKAEAPPAMVEVKAVETGLPDDLPPFGIKAALNRMNGKVPLLRKLIISFGERYDDVGGDLLKLIQAGDIADARRLAHTLKGVAGSLELLEVQEKSAAIERRLASDELDGIGDNIAELKLLVEPAIAAARRLSPAVVAPQAPAGIALDRQDSSAERDQLRDQIKRRSLQARGGFDAYAAAVGLNGQDAKQHPIRLALDRLDYDQALILLDRETALNA
ncbi:response regulator [Aureimonas fodinaquatilis]|uniref:response regulator n=1 Tax=Aureimonas fodinaquatilis TaxID=2565783 RepID=UPI003CCC7EB2